MKDKRVIQHFLKGQTIVDEGDLGDRTYRILAGEVMVCRFNERDELIPIARLGVSEIFGEMYMFEESKSRSATVVAASPEVKVEVLFREEVLQMLGPINPAMANLLIAYNNRLSRTSGNFARQHHGRKGRRLPDGTVRIGDPAFKQGYPAEE